jgi:hypothetical protein
VSAARWWKTILLATRKALNLLRPDIAYRREAFDAGLERAGYHIVRSLPEPRPGDALLIWNRYGFFATEAQRFESAGATVLVTENGWLGKGWRGGEWFTLCERHHAGAGEWHVGGPERWDGWGVDLSPWRDGSQTLVLGQRGIGELGIRSPDGWGERMAAKLKVRLRPHPGKSKGLPLEDDLADVGRVVTWNSGAALKALMLGVPVWHDFPLWIGAMASSRIGQPLVKDDAKRLAMFQRLAWSMWTLDEISTGEPIARQLLAVHLR